METPRNRGPRETRLVPVGSELTAIPSPPPGAPATAQEAAGTYLQALARYWPFVLCSVAIAVIVGLLTVVRSGDTYEASASILVSPLGAGDLTFTGTGVVVDTGDPARTVQTAAALLDSPRAAAAAAAAMGRAWSQAGVQAAVSVTPRGQSNVLAIAARAASAEEASKLANTFATAAVAARAQIVQGNVSAKLAALNARLKNSSSAAAQQELAARIVELEAVRATRADPTLQVAQQATPPGGSVGLSNLFLVILSGLVGFAVGSVGAVALAHFNPRISDGAEVSQLLPAPVLASVPKVTYAQRRRGLTPASMPPYAFEQIRKVRAQIYRPEPSVIMVTSADQGDGKTTIAAGLAAAFAEGNDEVILLDLDLRRPGLARLFGLEPAAWRPRDAGVGGLEQMLVPAPGLPHVRLLSARPANVAVLERVVGELPELLREARELARWVILDTPPVGEVSDGLRFAPECDSVVLVVRARHTDRSRLIQVYNQLNRIGANLVGTVVNDQQRVTKGSYAGPYHGLDWEVVETPSEYRGRWAAPAGGGRASLPNAD